MASVTVTYTDRVIAELAGNGSLILKTGGKYCEADIELAFIQHCPRTEQKSSYLLDDFFTGFVPTANAKDVTE